MTHRAAHQADTTGKHLDAPVSPNPPGATGNATGAQVYVVLRGSAPTEAVSEARSRIAHAARDTGTLLSVVRVRLSVPRSPDAGPVLAQANAHADGHPIRVQTTAPTLPEAIGALAERTRERLVATAHAWTPRPAPESEPAPRHLQAPVPGRITRFKTYRLAACPPQVAAATMDAWDYDIHLFTDPGTGADAAVYRAGPTGYRLALLRPPDPSHPARPPLLLDPHPAGPLRRGDAVDRLDATGAAHLFFADPHTGRGQILYRRHDGHYTLLTGAP